MANKTKVVNGKTYVLYAGRWHVQVVKATDTTTTTTKGA